MGHLAQTIIERNTTNNPTNYAAIGLLARTLESMTPGRWTQREEARFADNAPAPPLNPRAVTWCAAGHIALQQCDPLMDTRAAWKAISNSIEHVYPSLGMRQDLAVVNDELGHAAVIRVLMAAIRDLASR